MIDIGEASAAMPPPPPRAADPHIQQRMDRMRERRSSEIGLEPMEESGPEPVAARRGPNSTSSLYIESTIAKPDMCELCFCVSIVVYDLILQGEAQLAARQTAPPPPAEPAGSSTDDPYSLFRPRQIFQPAGKRNRSIFEGHEDDAPPSSSAAAKVPTEEDIRSAIADVHGTSNFSPGCLVVALIYIERLRRCSGAMLLASTWQPTLLISILVAQKVYARSALNAEAEGRGRMQRHVACNATLLTAPSCIGPLPPAPPRSPAHPPCSPPRPPPVRCGRTAAIPSCRP